jgi:uncharacterized protein YodC (DUF2158 family)
VDGKTPGEVFYDTLFQGCEEKASWSKLLAGDKVLYERASSAVLAAFGNQSLSAAIARMESVPWRELDKAWDEVSAAEFPAPCLEACFEAVRARLIAAAKEGQAEAVDWKAKADHWCDLHTVASARAEKAEAELARVIADFHFTKLPQLRPIAEAGPVPEGCVRVYFAWIEECWQVVARQHSQASHFADIRLPKEEKTEPSTFIAHGKTWISHDPKDPMPCDGEMEVQVITEGDHTLNPLRGKDWNWENGAIIGWRYADDPTSPIATLAQDQIQATPAMQAAAESVLTEEAFQPWTPAVGDVVRLKSGGPVMTVMQVQGDQCRTLWHECGEVQAFDFFNACLKPAKEEQP